MTSKAKKELVEEMIRVNNNITPYKIHMNTGISFKEIQHYWSKYTVAKQKYKAQLRANKEMQVIA